MAFSVSFALDKFPAEAALIGKILYQYAELEWELCSCLGDAINDANVAARTLFRVRGEKQRIEIADGLMRQAYQAANLIAAYDETIQAMQWCRRIRNQFAHCHWWDDPNGLYFLDLEHGARKSGPVMMVKYSKIDVSLLTAHDAYFSYTLRALIYLCREMRARTTGEAHHWTMPAHIEKPPLHLPDEKQVPPEIASR